jgi:hypothetical protein
MILGGEYHGVLQVVCAVLPTGVVFLLDSHGLCCSSTGDTAVTTANPQLAHLGRMTATEIPQADAIHSVM